MTICVQYLRISLSSFGEEGFQRFASNFCVQIIFGYYSANNVGGPTIVQIFKFSMFKLSLAIIYNVGGATI